MLLNKGGEKPWTSAVFCGKAPNHVQASTVTRQLIICICKYVEMILRAHFYQGFFLYKYI